MGSSWRLQERRLSNGRISSISKVVDKDSIGCDVGIMTALICAMRYINDGRYLPGYQAPELGHVKNDRKNNVEFYKTNTPDGPADLQCY